MAITVSSNSNISAVAGVTQTDELHATVADDIIISSATLTLGKNLFCLRLAITGNSSSVLIAGSQHKSVTLYVNPTVDANNYFGNNPPIRLNGYFTLENVEIVAGSNIANTFQTTLIGDFPGNSFSVSGGGANRVFKNVRIRAINQNGIHAYLPQCTIDGLFFDKIDFCLFETNPISAKNIRVSNSSWGVGQYDKASIQINSSIVTRVFLQRNNRTASLELKLVNVVVSERYMFRVAIGSTSSNLLYRLYTTLKITSGTAIASSTLFDKDANILVTQAADSGGNTTESAELEYLNFTTASVGVTPSSSTEQFPNNINNYVLSSDVADWQSNNTAKFTAIKVPFNVVHYGYLYIPSGQSIATIDVTSEDTVAGLVFSPKLFSDTGVTLSSAAAAALTSIATLENLYDASKVWNTLAVNCNYPGYGLQVIEKDGDYANIGARGMVFDSGASSVFDVNKITNLITIKASALTSTAKYKGIISGGTLTLASPSAYSGELQQISGSLILGANGDYSSVLGTVSASAIVQISDGLTNLETSTFANGVQANLRPGAMAAILQVAADQLASITPGTGVTLIAAQPTITITGFPSSSTVSISQAGIQRDLANNQNSPFVYQTQSSEANLYTIKVVAAGFEDFIVDLDKTIATSTSWVGIPLDSTDTINTAYGSFFELMAANTAFIRVVNSDLTLTKQFWTVTNWQAEWNAAVIADTPSSGEIAVWGGYLASSDYDAISFNASTGEVS